MANVSAEKIQYTPPPVVGASEWGDGRPGGRRRRASFTALFALLSAVTMLFAALTSSLLIRRTTGSDWEVIPVPGILYGNTLVIVASSVWLEMGRRALQEGRRQSFNWRWTAGSALGLAFLGGQILAWSQLRAAGVYMSRNPGSDFFYVFTVAHAVHVVGGIAALLYIETQALRLRLGPGKRTGVEISSYYWHFLAGLWIYLMLLFKFWG